MDPGHLETTVRLRRDTVLLTTAALLVGGVVTAAADHFAGVQLVCGTNVDAASCQDVLDVLQPSPIVPDAPTIAFLANGRNPADALAGGPVAGGLGAPILTTETNTLSPQALQGITDAGADLVIVLGGPVAIADSVLTQLAAGTGLTVQPSTTTVSPSTRGIVRVAGTDRFDTANKAAALLSVLDPFYLPVDTIALAAELAELATTAENAENVTFLQPFNVDLAFGDEEVVATSGPLSLVAVCAEGGDFDEQADGDDEQLLIELRSSEDGWFSVDDGGELLATDTVTVATVRNEEGALGDTNLDHLDNAAGARSAGGWFLSIDDYHPFTGLHVGESDCVAAGVAFTVAPPDAPS